MLPAQTRALLLLLTLLRPSAAALPPGNADDNTFCLATSCLMPHRQQTGWSGPRTAFWDCCNVKTGEKMRPRGWGVNMGYEYLDQLKAQGWGAVNPCSDAEMAVCGGVKKRSQELVMVEGAVNRLVVLMGAWL